VNDKPIFDVEYVAPVPTELESCKEKAPEPEEADARLQHSPLDPIKVYDTGRPWRKKREWIITNG